MILLTAIISSAVQQGVTTNIFIQKHCFAVCHWTAMYYNISSLDIVPADLVKQYHKYVSCALWTGLSIMQPRPLPLCCYVPRKVTL